MAGPFRSDFSSFLSRFVFDIDLWKDRRCCVDLAFLVRLHMRLAHAVLEPLDDLAGWGKAEDWIWEV